MKKKTTKITELVIDEENEALAIDAISLVTSPAIEVDFVFFGKEKNNLTFAKVDEEKRELIAPALIPNKQIYRYDANTDSDYYVYFSKDTVKKAAYSYLKHNNHHKATYQHEQRVAGVLTVESWIKEGDQDKSKLYGFDLSDGTWFVKMKIENDDLWQKIKEGELKGLSIEGYFVDKLEKMGKQYTDEQIRTAYKELQAEGKINKIELGLIDDIKKELVEAADKPTSKAMSLLGQSIKELQKAENNTKKVGKKIEKAQKQAKELGIDIPELKNYVALYKKNLNFFKQTIAEIKKAKIY
jgi:preprotein translocase subunit SecE